MQKCKRLHLCNTIPSLPANSISQTLDYWICCHCYCFTYVSHFPYECFIVFTMKSCKLIIMAMVFSLACSLAIFLWWRLCTVYLALFALCTYFAFGPKSWELHTSSLLSQSVHKVEVHELQITVFAQGKFQVISFQQMNELLMRWWNWYMLKILPWQLYRVLASNPKKEKGKNLHLLHRPHWSFLR